MIRLGVNIDHVATVRQARRASEPDPVAAAVLALLGGADGITVHLREDRRHIQDRDVRLLRPIVTNRLNLEMAAVDAIADIACEVKPDEATLVPERRQELTTEGGLDVVANEKAVARITQRLLAAGIEVSLFIDPDHRQIEAAKRLGVHAIEIQTAPLFGSRQERGPGAANPARCDGPGRGPRLARPHGPRVELPQRASHRRDERRRGVEHRPQHHLAGGAGRHGACRARDEGSDARGREGTALKEPRTQ